ncbi:nicotinamide mononucleotide transporter [Chitinophaga costaii]|uniref:Nicotinamide riboside transporter PnuC n=1 Tax=Chitinophaga costaii TaxID=1335309 RepID=A0A1C4AJ48_9BACT|nr:nicotinamide riboside transporter PnuC [Chitinophaga costaii]PUZ26623.1 nicotinamide riboside transporter PnuC [Chitinophaga costaii]SCB94580.1 nicotinamide mononucleotide transporter [Chitinophaga costaii]
MNIESVIQGMQAEFSHMNWLELVGVFFGVLSVLYSNRNKIYVYPTGLVSTGIYIYLFFAGGLYADAGLNVYYFVMSVYGWYHWTRKDNAEHVTPVAWTSRGELVTAVLIAVLGWGLIYLLLRYASDSIVPVWDSFVAATACSGMWLLAKRKVENWVLLNISNLAAEPLLIYKHYYLTAALTVFLFVVACFGFVNWKKIAAQEAAVLS